MNRWPTAWNKCSSLVLSHSRGGISWLLNETNGREFRSEGRLYIKIAPLASREPSKGLFEAIYDQATSLFIAKVIRFISRPQDVQRNVSAFGVELADFYFFGCPDPDSIKVKGRKWLKKKRTIKSVFFLLTFTLLPYRATKALLFYVYRLKRWVMFYWFCEW